MTQRVIRRVTTTKIEEEILADDGQGQPGQLEARLGGDGGNDKDDDGDGVAATRRGARVGRVKLALPPLSRPRARTDHADTGDDGGEGEAHLEDDGGHGDDNADVVEVARAAARAGRGKSAQPSPSRPRGRNDR
jgi:hypothetical protein